MCPPPVRAEIYLTDGVQNLVYSSNTCCGPTTPPHDYGIVAVIDGSKLVNIWCTEYFLIWCRMPKSYANTSHKCTPTHGIT